MAARKRLYISVSSEAEMVIGALAKREGIPRATKARHLLEESVLRQEDIDLAEIVNRRRKEKGLFVSHADAWR